jgi:predicted lactoylglutathione lyase
MPKKIFINLPVTDLDRSKKFYGAIGARNEPKFTDGNAAMMVLSETIYVMLLKHDFYSTFTRKPIADARQSSQVLLALSADSAADVDALVEKASSAGGLKDPGP